MGVTTGGSWLLDLGGVLESAKIIYRSLMIDEPFFKSIIKINTLKLLFFVHI